jgi:predicted O-methyltransferase YrrM
MSDSPDGIVAARTGAADQRWRVRAPRRLAEPRDLWRMTTRFPLALALARAALRDPRAFAIAASAIRAHGALQKPLELAAYLRFLRSRRIARALEIGVASGGTLFAHAAVADPRGHLLAIDAHPSLEPDVMTARCRHLARPSQSLTCLWRDAHDAGTVAAVREALAREPLDLLFIDGDHSADGVARHHALYAPLVRPGGLIAFHDIDAGHAHGVTSCWRALASRHVHHEFVDRAHPPHGLGIGVLVLP